MYDRRYFSEIPSGLPGLYALYDGHDGNKCVYVGKSDTGLRRRVLHHLVDRNSSVTTGVAGASINIENLTMVRWWTNEEFNDKIFLDAAEAYFFDQLEPMLRSRGNRIRGTYDLLNDSNFLNNVERILSNPSGKIELLSYGKLLLKVKELECRISELEKN